MCYGTVSDRLTANFAMADRSPCFYFQTFHKMWFSLRRYRSKKVLPHRQWLSLSFSTQYGEAKLYWPAKLYKAGWAVRVSTSQKCSRAARLGKLSSLSFSAEQNCSSSCFFLQGLVYFEHFLLFLSNLRAFKAETVSFTRCWFVPQISTWLWFLQSEFLLVYVLSDVRSD